MCWIEVSFISFFFAFLVRWMYIFSYPLQRNSIHSICSATTVLMTTHTSSNPFANFVYKTYFRFLTIHFAFVMDRVGDSLFILSSASNMSPHGLLTLFRQAPLPHKSNIQYLYSYFSLEMLCEIIKINQCIEYLNSSIHFSRRNFYLILWNFRSELLHSKDMWIYMCGCESLPSFSE